MQLYRWTNRFICNISTENDILIIAGLKFNKIKFLFHVKRRLMELFKCIFYCQLIYLGRQANIKHFIYLFYKLFICCILKISTKISMVFDKINSKFAHIYKNYVILFKLGVNRRKADEKRERTDLASCISVLLLLKDFIYLYLQYLLYTISRKRRIFKALEALFAFLLVQIVRKIVLNGIKCAHENSFLSCGYFWHFIILNLFIKQI